MLPPHSRANAGEPSSIMLHIIANIQRALCCKVRSRSPLDALSLCTEHGRVRANWDESKHSRTRVDLPKFLNSSKFYIANSKYWFYTPHIIIIKKNSKTGAIAILPLLKSALADTLYEWRCLLSTNGFYFLTSSTILFANVFTIILKTNVVFEFSLNNFHRTRTIIINI